MTDLLEEAENCRRKAHAYVGLPEASFLLRVAEGFERVAADRYEKSERSVDSLARSESPLISR